MDRIFLSLSMTIGYKWILGVRTMQTHDYNPSEAVGGLAATSYSMPDRKI